MSEQERERPPPVSERPAEGRRKPHERLPELVTLAFQETDEDEQRRYTVDVVDALIAMRAPGDEAEECRLIVAHLEAKTLNRLVDSNGRSAHKEAVETLLSLGFPHALQVAPEDLQKYRDGTLGGELLELTKARRQASLIAFASQAAGIGYWAYAQPNAALPWLVGSAVTGLAGAWMMQSLHPRDDTALPFGLLVGSTLAALGAGFASLPLFALFGGMLAATLIARGGAAKKNEL